MEVIPAIDLRDGRCVRLYQGDYDRETVFSPDPAATARRWVDLGATRLHVVDLDGAATGRVVNQAALAAILAAVSVPVQLGGGLRDMASIAGAMEQGVERVVLGTSAVSNPDLVETACGRYPGAVIVSIDAREGRVAVQGWREATDVSALDLLRRMEEVGVSRFVYTDISRDGTQTEPNYQALSEVISATNGAVIASGGVGKLEHLRRLQALGVEAAIVGQALYTGSLDLADALQALAAAP